jgi:hypothetical protein
MTRLDFEAKPEWRATIKRRDGIAFILAGQGPYVGRFYEFPDDGNPFNGFSHPVEIGVRLRHQLATGEIELLKGTLPLTEEVNDA